MLLALLSSASLCIFSLFSVHVTLTSNTFFSLHLCVMMVSHNLKLEKMCFSYLGNNMKKVNILFNFFLKRKKRIKHRIFSITAAQVSQLKDHVVCVIMGICDHHL